jgi:hypothetical protein
MKKINYLSLVAIIVLSSCAKQGLEGKKSLINLVAETAGINCPTGGYKIMSGIDQNNNDVLDDAEVQSTKYVCNGITGSNSLTSMVPESSGTNCKTGGYKINTGIDLNGNKLLEVNEVMNTEYLCNGLTGNNSLVTMVPETAGANCPNGGYKTSSGTDENGNGILEANEVKSVSYVCNGVNGLNYLVRIKPESAGSNCINGGYSFLTGIDVNKNGILEDAEVTNTAFVCNGSAASEIRIPLDFSANTMSSQGVSGLALSNFNKANYTGLESIVLAARPYSGDLSNYAIVTLINSTDNVAINESKVQSNNPSLDTFVESQNILSALPNKPINIYLELRSEKNGSFSGVYGTSYLILSFKK